MVNKIIKVNFKGSHKTQEANFLAFQKAMEKHQQEQRFKLAFQMVLFCGIIILAMALPFVIDYWRLN